MSQIADLVAYDAEGQIALVAEIKNRPGASRAWAAQMRRNLLAHGSIPNSRYFLLALPDRFYLWRDAGNTPGEMEPSYELDATLFLQPYYAEAQLSPNSVSGQSFELIVAAWLNGLIWSGIPASVPETQRRLLEDSGLLKTLEGGSVMSAVRV